MRRCLSTRFLGAPCRSVIHVSVGFSAMTTFYLHRLLPLGYSVHKVEATWKATTTGAPGTPENRWSRLRSFATVHHNKVGFGIGHLSLTCVHLWQICCRDIHLPDDIWVEMECMASAQPVFRPQLWLLAQRDDWQKGDMPAHNVSIWCMRVCVGVCVCVEIYE